MNKLGIFFFFVIFGILLTNKAFAGISLINYSDTSNIISYHDKLGLYVYSIRKFRNYELKNEALNLKLRFTPNGQTNHGIGFNYKWMGLGLAFSFPFSGRDNDVFGETKRFDLQLNLFSRFSGLNVYYQNYNGFYLSNPKDFSVWNKLYYPKLNDLNCTSTGVYAFYWFNNKKFSYKAAYVRNELQQKSAGGVLLGAFADLDEVYAPSGFIPKELPDSLNQIFDFKGYTTYVFGISAGYAYTLVLFKHAFINLSVSPGIGYRNLTVWHIIENDKVKPDLSGSLKGKFSIGVETKHFYFGASSIGSMESFKYEEVDISTASGQVRFYVGKRFNVEQHHRQTTQNISSFFY